MRLMRGNAAMNGMVEVKGPDHDDRDNHDPYEPIKGGLVLHK